MKVDRLVATDFLIDRWRNGEASDASLYARAHREDSLAISWIVKGDFLRAAETARYDSPEVVKFLARYPTQWPDEEIVIGYARLSVRFRQQSFSFAANDLWLAASALRLSVPLVTRNTNAFAKVSGIRLDPF